MSKRNIFFISIFFLVMFTAIFLAACASSNSTNGTPATSAPTSATTADGQALMMDHCAKCHSITRVTSKQKSAAEWTTTVDRMIARGAKLTPQEEQTLIQYLAQNY